MLITIIVLVVLAAVVIVNLTGEDNIVEKGIAGVEAYDISQYEETIRLAETEARLDRMENKEIVFLDRVQEILEKDPNFKEAIMKRISYEEKDSLIIFIKNHAFVVNDDGVKYLGTAKDFNVPSAEEPRGEITGMPTSAYVNEPKTATVGIEAGESGLNLEECKWAYVASNEEIGENPSDYPNTLTSENGLVTIAATSEGTWYLHVLITDNAGNRVEIVSTGVIVTTLPESVSTATTFGYTGAIQSYVVPVTGVYKLEVNGASAGNGTTLSGNPGGKSTGYKYLEEGTRLYIGVGQKGADYAGVNKNTGYAYNGGASGYGKEAVTVCTGGRRLYSYCD